MPIICFSATNVNNLVRGKDGHLNLQAKINKMVNRNSVHYNPAPPRTNLKDTSSHISKNSLGLYFSAEYLLNALSELYIPPNFQINGIQIRWNTFASQKIESIFTHAPRTPPPPPVSYHYTPEREITHSPRQQNLFSASRNGREGKLYDETF